jgi:hypothetical protein
MYSTSEIRTGWSIIHTFPHLTFLKMNRCNNIWRHQITCRLLALGYQFSISFFWISRTELGAFVKLNCQLRVCAYVRVLGLGGSKFRGNNDPSNSKRKGSVRPAPARACRWWMGSACAGRLMAGGWCWFVPREEYCWLIADADLFWEKSTAGCWLINQTNRTRIEITRLLPVSFSVHGRLAGACICLSAWTGPS